MHTLTSTETSGLPHARTALLCICPLVIVDLRNGERSIAEAVGPLRDSRLHLLSIFVYRTRTRSRWLP